MSGKFQDKIAALKQKITEKASRNNENLEQNRPVHTCSNIQIKIDDGNSNKLSRNDLCIQQPIIINKK